MGRAYDKFNSQYRHSRRLQEIRESDRSVKSRLSSCSIGRSGVAVDSHLMENYKQNHVNHNVFTAREHTNSVTKRNEEMFKRIQ